MIDNEDCKKMRSLSKNFNTVSKIKNNAVSEWMLAESELDVGIVNNRISEKLSWKKQVLELCKIDSTFLEHHRKYIEGKRDEKRCQNALKAIENEINVLKKTYDETPT